MKKNKILIVSRDSAATFNNIEIAKAAINSNIFDVCIYAQYPAIYHYKNAGFNPSIVPFQPIKNKEIKEYDQLIQYCKNLIDFERPDIILTGLSTPYDGGIDEAIVKCAKGKIPTVLMQDFWGEINQFFGETADYCFCLDEDSEQITFNQHGIDCFVIGSPRHAHLGCTNILDRRKKIRKTLQLNSGNKIIGYFGQGLHHLKGYHQILESWAKNIRLLGESIQICYKPHPRETLEEINLTKAIFNKHDIKYIELVDHQVENALLPCDLIFSIFSNCTYDASYLNYFSNEPLIVPVLLYFNEEIKNYINKYIENFPYLKKKLAIGIDNEAELHYQIQCMMDDPNIKNQIWHSSKKLKNPKDAPLLALENFNKILRTA